MNTIPGGLWARLRRRRLAQWALAYLGAGWLAVEVLSVLAAPFGWPSLVVRAATVLVGVGLVGVLVLAWYHGERGQQRVSGRELILLAGVLLLAGAAVWWVREDPAAAAGGAGTLHAPLPGVERGSIAVLPFADLSDTGDQDYFSDGIAEEILNTLATVPGLRVAARTSSFSFRGRATPVDEIATRLRVAHVLEGSVRKSGDRVRITAQLIDAAGGHELWSQEFERRLDDIFAIQDEISRAIADRLALELGGAATASLVHRATTNQQAYDHYLRGRHLWAKRTPDGLHGAIRHFEQAIRLDPSFARAHAGLADALIVLPIYTAARPSDAQPRAKAAAERALALDSTLAEARASLAYIRMSYERDWAGAEPAFAEALRLNPNYATAQQWYGDFLAATGRVPEACAAYERAMRLDPLAAVFGLSAGWCYMATRRFEQAVRVFEASLELDPTLVDLRTHLARTRLYQRACTRDDPRRQSPDWRTRSSDPAGAPTSWRSSAMPTP